MTGKITNIDFFRKKAEQIVIDNGIDLSESDTLKLTQGGIEYVYRNGKPVGVKWNEIIKGKNVERSLNL